MIRSCCAILLLFISGNAWSQPRLDEDLYQFSVSLEDSFTKAFKAGNVAGCENLLDEFEQHFKEGNWANQKLLLRQKANYNYNLAVLQAKKRRSGRL